MKKKLIITESQYKRLINEQEDYTEQLLLLINSNDETNLEMVKEIAPGQGIDLVEFLSDNIKQIEPPYFYKFNILGIDEKEQLEIIKNIKDDYSVRGTVGYYGIYDPYENRIYAEGPDGSWNKKEYNKNQKVIYYENNRGYWYKKEYDSSGNEIYNEDSDGKIIDNR